MICCPSRMMFISTVSGFSSKCPFLYANTFLDFIRYVATSGAPEKEVLLDENDELWVEMRHEHIAIVSQSVLFDFSKEMYFIIFNIRIYKILLVSSGK